MREEIKRYVGCKCPHCKSPLDQVAEGTPQCPNCRKPLARDKVWDTRAYEGHLILPSWVTAFGWPLLLILAGAGTFLATAIWGGGGETRLSGLLIAIGLVFFVVKLFGYDK